jgi:hypothetical protein
LKKFLKVSTIILVVIGILWMTFSYNNRPKPFEDQPAQQNPVEEIATGAANKVNETAKNAGDIDFGKIWEDVQNKAKEIGGTGANENSAPSDNGVPTNVDMTAVKIGDPRKTGYERTAFGDAWEDVDHNGCDTRNDVLARDLTNIVRTDNCTVASGTLQDKYTGTTIDFVRGKSKVDIDHVIPLSYAYQQGASDWTPAKREALANDPVNLSASSASANRSKSDSGPSEWMPSNASYRCEYGKKFAAVAVKYDLPITQGDYNTIQAACR